MYTVKQVAEIMHISAHTIRFYDNEGLIPYVTRNENHVRLFSESDLDWLSMIQCLKLTGMSLAEIKRYVQLCKEGDKTTEERYKIILSQREKAKNELNNAKKRLDTLDKKVNYYKEILNEQNDNPCNSENLKVELL